MRMPPLTEHAGSQKAWPRSCRAPSWRSMSPARCPAAAGRGLGSANSSGSRPAVAREPQQSVFKHDGEVQVTVAVRVEQHRDLVRVVALHRAIAPAVAHDSRAYGKRDVDRHGFWVSEVVVAVAAGTGIILPEVREQERAPAAGVLGVVAHHPEPRALHL